MAENDHSRGMLDAVICVSGQILASTHIVCYLLAAGDRLHFGLAVEQAKAEGLKVDMLVVGDDCALASKDLVGRRGVAGTVLVLKVSWGGHLLARFCGSRTTAVLADMLRHVCCCC